MGNSIKIIDFHSHILPGMDDGARDVEESINILKLSKDAGVKAMVATPHFYPNEEQLKSFLERRKQSIELLLSRYDKALCPDIYIGAEVLYYKGIGKSHMLDKLCIMGTDCILIELPFGRWDNSIVQEIKEIKDNGYTPVIAHLDRYMKFQKKDILGQLFYDDILIQINVEYLFKRFKSRKILSMIDNNLVHLLGSDCHNMLDRRQNLDKAIKLLQDLGREDALSRINFVSKLVLKDAILLG